MVGTTWTRHYVEELMFVGPEDREQVLAELPSGLEAEARVTVTAVRRNGTQPFDVEFTDRDGRTQRMPLWAFSAWFQEDGR